MKTGLSTPHISVLPGVSSYAAHCISGAPLWNKQWLLKGSFGGGFYSLHFQLYFFCANRNDWHPSSVSTPEKEILIKTIFHSHCPQLPPSHFGEPQAPAGHPEGMAPHARQGYSCSIYHLDTSAPSQGFLNFFLTVPSPLSSMLWPLLWCLTTSSVEIFFSYVQLNFPFL